MRQSKIQLQNLNSEMSGTFGQVMPKQNLEVKEDPKTAKFKRTLMFGV